MMKLVAFIFLFAVVFVTADLQAGQREEGDVLVASRKLARPAQPGKPSLAISGFNTAGNITAVNASNGPGSNAAIKIVSGGPGTGKVVVAAVSPVGEGLDVQLDIYAQLPPASTPPPPPPAENF